METFVRRARLRGLETGWTETTDPGDGAPILLFLHGYPDSPEVWERQRDFFGRRFFVICPFARGLAPSQATSSRGRYGRDATTLDVLQILREVDASGRRSVYLVGHDLGVVHACHLAPHLGDRLRALVLFNGLSLPQMARRLGSPRQLLKSWYISFFQLPGVPEWLASRFPSTMLSLMRKAGGLPVPKKRDVPRAAEQLGSPVNQYRAFVRELPRALRRRQPRLACPTLVVWGRRDPFLLVPTLDEWESVAADVTVRLLDAGHWVYVERADEVNRLMDEFFAKTQRKGGEIAHG